MAPGSKASKPNLIAPGSGKIRWLAQPNHVLACLTAVLLASTQAAAGRGGDGSVYDNKNKCAPAVLM